MGKIKFREFEKSEDDGRLEDEISHNILYFENSELTPKNINIGYNSFSGEIETLKEEIKYLY